MKSKPNFLIRSKKKTWTKPFLVIVFVLGLTLISKAGAENKKNSPDKNRPTVTFNSSLLRSIPETEGVSSQGIIDFLDEAGRSGIEFHSFMFLRHGKVIAEGWWNPYRSDLKQTMYSLSKSFTSTAIGFAVNEKRLTVKDKVISFFPKDLPDSISPFLAELSVKDLLTMSVGQASDPTFSIVAKDSNWVKSFLALPLVNKPCSKFLYNSMASYMLSAIVQKVTGEKEIDYLTPRLFQPLGIKDMDWEVDPTNINTGGWGLRLKTEDMAKFGQFYLQKGKWNNKQRLSSEWVEEATTIKIQQSPELPQAARDTNDWMKGYCYQFWRCRNNAFRGDGAYGQFIVMMPDQDAVVVFTSETQKPQAELNLLWKYLLPAMHNDKLPLNNLLSTNLRQRLASLALPLPENRESPASVSSVSHKTFVFPPNPRHLESILFKFDTDTCHLTMKIDKIDYQLNFGAGKWITGQTTKQGPNLLSIAKAHSVGLPPFRVAGSYGWENANTLELVLRYIESPHRETITCKFDQNNVAVEFQNSNATHKVMLEGKRME